MRKSKIREMKAAQADTNKWTTKQTKDLQECIDAGITNCRILFDSGAFGSHSRDAIKYKVYTMRGTK